MMRRALYALFSLTLAAVAVADVYLVTSTGDSGPGTLRQAILDANAHPGLDSIHFGLPGFSLQAGINTVGPLVITSPVLIDGTTQADAFTPIFVGFSGNEDGFVFDTGSDGSLLRHLEIAGVLGSDRAAIRILGASGVKIAGNVIGGTAGVLSMNFIGIAINTSGNQIGGTSVTDRNVIGGNSIGISIDAGANDNVIEGNYIGVDRDGTTRRANTSTGITIANGNGNIIGGTSDASRNLIAASPAGILIFKPSSGNRIERNYIGTTAAGGGSSDLRNVQGIILGGNGENVVVRNLISNNVTGILVAEGFNQVIQGNKIGTDPEGGTAVPNGSGIVVPNITDVHELVIGGPFAGEGNHISGNTDDGILIESTSVIRIEGNVIGINAIGDAPLGNGTGVRLLATESTLLGGPIARAGNVISGNRGDGIFASRGTILSNLIGVAANGIDPIPNRGNGIAAVTDGSLVIGAANGGNVIAYNLGYGIDVSGNANVVARAIEYNSIRNNVAGGIRMRENSRHRIHRNSIGRNGGLGIDLGGDGVTPNDSGDNDTGPNQRQNYPVLTGFSATSTQLSVRGTLNSRPNATYSLDFYRSFESDPSGFGEGETYLGSTSVTTNAFGDATFTAVLPAADTSLRFITATATDAAGNTSEFSRAMFIGPTGPPKRRAVRH